MTRLIDFFHVEIVPIPFCYPVRQFRLSSDSVEGLLEKINFFANFESVNHMKRTRWKMMGRVENWPRMKEFMGSRILFSTPAKGINQKLPCHSRGFDLHNFAKTKFPELNLQIIRTVPIYSFSCCKRFVCCRKVVNLKVFLSRNFVSCLKFKFRDSFPFSRRLELAHTWTHSLCFILVLLDNYDWV